MKNNKYLKIALLAESLNYEKPIYSSAENPIKSEKLARATMQERDILR